MAATFENRTLEQPAANARRSVLRRGPRPYALAGLALSAVIALAVPSTQAVSRGLYSEPAAISAANALPSEVSADAVTERRPSATTPRSMTSADRQAIFMVLMLQGPNASSQILGLTR